VAPKLDPSLELPELPAAARATPPRWAPWTAPVALIAAFAAAIVGYVVIGIIGSVAGAGLDDPPPAVQISATVFQDLCLIGSALLFARLAVRPRAWQFGLRPTRFWPALGLVVAAWLAFIIFSAIWVSALGISERDDLPDQLGASESTVALLAVAFLVCVVAPIAEEFFFRGYFFTALRSWKGPWPAAVLTGIVFGGIHAGSAPVGYLVPLALLGFILCLLYWKTGSLYPCIVLHCINNSIAFGVSQHWNWQIVVVIVASIAVIALLLLPFARSGRAAGAVQEPA